MVRTPPKVGKRPGRPQGSRMGPRKDLAWTQPGPSPDSNWNPLGTPLSGPPNSSWTVGCTKSDQASPCAQSGLARELSGPDPNLSFRKALPSLLSVVSQEAEEAFEEQKRATEAQLKKANEEVLFLCLLQCMCMPSRSLCGSGYFGREQGWLVSYVASPNFSFNRPTTAIYESGFDCPPLSPLTQATCNYCRPPKGVGGRGADQNVLELCVHGGLPCSFAP